MFLFLTNLSMDFCCWSFCLIFASYSASCLQGKFYCWSFGISPTRNSLLSVSAKLHFYAHCYYYYQIHDIPCLQITFFPKNNFFQTEKWIIIAEMTNVKRLWQMISSKIKNKFEIIIYSISLKYFGIEAGIETTKLIMH